jgi:RNA polymerase sigma-70 factor (ECF subfamily)
MPSDRRLLQRCLNHEPGSWSDFVDQFLGLIYHVVRQTGQQQGRELPPDDVEDLAAEVLSQVVARDYAVLRHFKGQGTLASYLSVIARRACLHHLVERAAEHAVHGAGSQQLADYEDQAPPAADGLSQLEEVQQLLRTLPPRERRVVSMFYLEGRTYEEISEELEVPVNSIGPILARARKKLREGSSGISGHDSH